MGTAAYITPGINSNRIEINPGPGYEAQANWSVESERMGDYRERLRRPPNTPQFRGGRPRQHELSFRDRIRIERDIAVPTREGKPLWIDLFLPADLTGPIPVLVAWTPYGKHDPAPLATLYPTSGVKAEWQSDLTIFEAPDPVYWTGQGYAVITADIPGTWYAETAASYFSRKEGEAHYDLIEWAGTQPWSNGRVGLSGVSYLSSSQWNVAALNPPHLAAINPWEGWSDTFNEIVRHGGIPETHFWPHIQVRWGASDTMVEDLWAFTAEHPFFDEYWQSKVPDFGRIDVPAYVVASWSDHGVHTRGTLEGFKKIASSRKWLEVHGGKKWGYYYEPASIARQTAFFDHVLKGVSNDMGAWPPIRLHVRDKAGSAIMKQSEQWPVENTQYRRLYLDAATGHMSGKPVAAEAIRSYDPLDDAAEATFDYRFEEDCALVGHMKLKLIVSTEDADDMDVFVAVEKVEDGEKVGFIHWAVFEDGAAAYGWLRLSRRELDAERSTEFQPVLTNTSEWKVTPGEIVEAQIEILPSGTLFRAGDVLRIRIKGRDIYQYPKPMLYMRHEDTVNRGMHHIHTGGEHDSHLLIPVVALRDA
ncbi:CocE/NonD family hydrolase [Sphingobium sp. B12D2B]|uniref:CocE/NonD family hydrolase n=1 Tax=Sphingobium sp. B12D2B TaxID=2940577 RepID=UPI0022253711|nr:CocE/NonD family hydrolase [Sphingobium sp. B12D2B]MCW2351329.1 putative acyl esterase [Sphingobium sp. B12D2B]